MYILFYFSDNRLNNLCVVPTSPSKNLKEQFSLVERYKYSRDCDLLVKEQIKELPYLSNGCTSKKQTNSHNKTRKKTESRISVVNLQCVVF